MGKPDFRKCKNKDTDQLYRSQLISAFVIATQIVHFLFFFNPKFQCSGLFLDCTGRFVWDLVSYLDGQFSCIMANINLMEKYEKGICSL